MSKLNLKKLQPGDNVSFIVEGKIFDEVTRSARIDIKVPLAAPLMNKVPVTYTPPLVFYKIVYNGGDEYGFSRYMKAGRLGTGYFKLRLYFDTKKVKNQLSNGDFVKIKTSTSSVSTLNNVTATVYASGTPNGGAGSFIDLKVSEFYEPALKSGTTNKNVDYIKESTGRRKQKSYTIQIPDAEVFQQLINVKENPTGTSSWAVRDIPIYAYRNYDGKITSDDKLLSMLDDSQISFKKPPDYSTSLESNFLQKSYTKIFDIGDKPNYIFYVAIARYTKNNGVWAGEWLQTNSSNKPIWGKAIKSGN